MEQLIFLGVGFVAGVLVTLKHGEKANGLVTRAKEAWLWVYSKTFGRGE
jgi:hypothetical protein